MRTLGLGLLAILATTFALLGNGAPVAAEPTDKEKSEMAAKVYTLLKDKCESCHGEKAKQPGWKKTITHLLDYDKLMAQNVIDLEKPEESKLYEEINEGEMPRVLAEDGKSYVKKKLPQADIDLVLNWIKAGTPKWEIPAEWTWRQVKSDGPVARTHHAMCEGPGGTVVLLGGVRNIQANPETLKDTWVFSNGRWAKASPRHHPAVTSDCVCAYDANRAKTVLFGGLSWGTTDPVASTWEWDGVDWTEIKTLKSPMPRMNPALAYDDARKRVVLFGGFIQSKGSEDVELYHDTWQYDGLEWREVRTEIFPSSRHGSSLSFDPVTKKVLLIGGFANSRALNDSWLFDGRHWSSLNDAGFPADRIGLSIASGGGELFVCAPSGGREGDREPSREYWSWNGQAWAKRGDCPFSTNSAAFVWCEADKCFVLFGGYLENELTDQTWLLSKSN